MYKIDIQRIKEKVAEGWIDEDRWNDLSIFHYSAKSRFENHIDDDTLNCRGLILNQHGDVIARPFRRFFDYGERVPMPGTFLVEATEKLDGSIGILFQHDHEWWITGSKRFMSPHILWATEYFRREVGQIDPDLNDWTLIFECIHPDNRIVVDYHGFIGLALIGCRHKVFGYEKYGAELDEIAGRYDFYRPTTSAFASAEQAVEMSELLTANEEGWVLRFSDNERYKVKGKAYRLAHRAMTGISFRGVLNAVKNETFDKFIITVDADYGQQARAWRQEIQDKIDYFKSTVEEELTRAPHTTEHKVFAQWVRENHPTWMHDYLFAIWNDKPIDKMVLRHAFNHRVHEELLEEEKRKRK